MIALLAGALACREAPSPPPLTTAPRDAAELALPPSPDGEAERRSLDVQIERALDPGEAIPLLLERAAIDGGVADLEVALDRSARWIGDAPTSAMAWGARARALAAVHRFAAARQAVEQLRAIDRDPSVADELAASIDEATGHHARTAAYRERRAAEHATPANLVALAHQRALAGQLDEALALMPRAVAAIRHNPARLVGWILFQWGLLHEQRGELAAARRYHALAVERFPAALPAHVHLAEVTRSTGGDPAALVRAALERFGPRPELLALAGRIDEARVAWERYVAALPEAYADHAARFFLGVGRDPVRALALARVNLAARDTVPARALVVEAALAAGDHGAACEHVAPLESGRRGDRFLAWRALSACGEVQRARALATALGI